MQCPRGGGRLRGGDQPRGDAAARLLHDQQEPEQRWVGAGVGRTNSLALESFFRVIYSALIVYDLRFLSGKQGVGVSKLYTRAGLRSPLMEKLLAISYCITKQ